MITKAIIFEGEPGSGPEREPDPKPFGVNPLCVCPMGDTGSRKGCPVHVPEAFGDDRTADTQPVPQALPVKRGPGRPRKTPA